MPVPAPPVAFPISPSSSRRTPIGRDRKPCADMPRRLWPANRTPLPPIGSSAIRRSAPTGKVREAEILINSGDLDGGTAALAGRLDRRRFRSSRREEFSRPPFRLRCGRRTMHKRIDRLLWDGQTEAAHRMLPLVPSEYRPLAEARLALAAQAAQRRDAGGTGSGAACVPIRDLSSSSCAGGAKRI